MSKLTDILKVNSLYSASKRKKLNIEKYQLERMIVRNGKPVSERDKLYRQSEDNFINDVKKAKNSTDLGRLIVANKENYTTASKQLRLDILMYPSIRRLDNAMSFKFVPFPVVNAALNNHYTPEDLSKVEEQYSTILTNYISNHNAIKNPLYPTSDKGIADYTKPFDQKMLKDVFEELTGKKVNPNEYSISTRAQSFASNVIVPFMALYSSEDLEKRKDLIEFEMNNGYFDRYYSNLTKGQPVPSISERERIFNNEKSLTTSQITIFNQAEVLQSKISLLRNEKAKETLLGVLETAVKEKDYAKLEKVHEYYQKTYKEEIVRSLYSPGNQGITVLEDYDDLKNIMIHSFFRNPNSIINRYEKELREEIMAARKTDKDNPNLSPLEQEIFEGKMKKAREQLANQVVTDKTFTLDSVYSDASNIFQYKSNTSNQLSVSVVSPEHILNSGSAIGIGFDQKGVPSENILISSPIYLTTNKGLNNIELPGSKLESASATLSEMEKASANEIVLARNGQNFSTKPSYIFVTITERNIEKDKELLERGKKLAKDNNLPLVVINVPKLQQSYQEKQNKEKKVTR